MNIELYKLPTLNKNCLFDIEKICCEIYNKKRAGEHIPVEVLDWFDSANTFLEVNNE